MTEIRVVGGLTIRFRSYWTQYPQAESDAMPLTSFHPIVAQWFNTHFDAPSDVQRQAWPAIRAGESTLIAAPTGSGKTLAAFLAAIDQLVQQGLESPLPDETGFSTYRRSKRCPTIFTKTWNCR